MTRRPDPYAASPGSPRNGRLYAVRYLDTRGRGVTELFRTRPAAERYAEHVEVRGGVCAIYCTSLDGWEAA